MPPKPRPRGPPTPISMCLDRYEDVEWFSNRILTKEENPGVGSRIPGVRNESKLKCLKCSSIASAMRLS